MKNLALAKGVNYATIFHFDLKDIDEIIYRPAKDIYDEAELEKNGYKPLELLMSISFKNGGHANFSVNNDWTIFFE